MTAHPRRSASSSTAFEEVGHEVCKISGQVEDRVGDLRRPGLKRFSGLFPRGTCPRAPPRLRDCNPCVEEIIYQAISLRMPPARLEGEGKWPAHPKTTRLLRPCGDCRNCSRSARRTPHRSAGAAAGGEVARSAAEPPARLPRLRHCATDTLAASPALRAPRPARPAPPARPWLAGKRVRRLPPSGPWRRCSAAAPGSWPISRPWRMLKRHGMAMPLFVRIDSQRPGDLQLFVGYRRWRAALLAGSRRCRADQCRG